MRRICGRKFRGLRESGRLAWRDRAAILRTPRLRGKQRSDLEQKQQKTEHRSGVPFFGAPAENRTPDTLIKSQKTQFSDVLRLCRMHKRKRHQSASCGTDQGSAHAAAGEKTLEQLYTLHKLAERDKNREVKRGREDMLTNFSPRVLAKKLGGIPD